MSTAEHDKTGPGIDIRRADEHDIPAILEIERACFSTPWGELAVRGELENGYSTLFLAEENGTPVGWAGLEAICGEGDVSNIAVLPERRRRGIGEMLTCTLIAECRRQKLSSLTLEVRVSNAPAIALYEKLGFYSLGIRPGFYDNPTEDAMMMRTDRKEPDII